MSALNSVLADGAILTRDLGGSASTIEYTTAICERL
jgi:isocitrate/isopropylmalate dehydrogenase